MFALSNDAFGFCLAISGTEFSAERGNKNFSANDAGAGLLRTCVDMNLAVFRLCFKFKIIRGIVVFVKIAVVNFKAFGNIAVIVLPNRTID